MASESVRKTAGKASEGRPTVAGTKPRATGETRKTKAVLPRAAVAARKGVVASSKAPTPPAASPDASQRGATAIEKVHNAVKAHQSRVFGTIFGLGQPDDGGAGDARKDPWRAAARAIADPLGLRKFEDVFDQRVATALERLGWPTPEELQHVRDQVEAMAEYLRSAESAASRNKPKR